MSLIKEIYDRVVASAGVTSLVGARIYPVVVPSKATLPYVVFSVIDSDPSVTHGEASDQEFVVVQFSAFSKARQDGGVYDDARAIIAEVVAALDTAPLPSGVIGSLETGPRDGFDDVIDSYRCDADLSF